MIKIKKSLRKTYSSKRTSDLHNRAKSKLSRFKQSSLIAVATTGFLLLLLDARADETDINLESDNPVTAVAAESAKSVEQATGTIQQLIVSFYSFLPKLLISIAIFLLGWGVIKIVRKLSGASMKAKSIIALVQIGVYFTAIVVAVSIIVGDVRALLGSLGLIGLALSWSLQTPIESFTGWVLNTFRVYYRVGDRIEVGGVFGDVYKIDYLTTTVWEAGGPGKPVTGAQPTGAMITFPNSEVLRSNIVNYTRDFPFVWDEVTVGIANESDLSYAIDVIRKKSEEVLGEQMSRSVNDYRQLLIHQGLNYDIEDKPQVYLSLTDSWVNCTVRYLVGVRSRRRWSSVLIEKIYEELSKKEHRDRIRPSYPRQETFLSWRSEEV